jgi:hypothetical protein
VEVAVLGALLSAAAAALIAIRAGSQLVAAYGLVAVLVAPPIMGASPNFTTLGFVALALCGVTAIALYRTWSWLPPTAFVLAAPQFWSWLAGSPAPGAALVALAGFWSLNVLAAGGEEFRNRTDRLRPTSATLLLTNAAFVVAAGFMILTGELAVYRGLFLAIMAVAHFAVGGWFLRAEGDRHPFGLVVVGTGIAALTMAIPIQFSGPQVPIAWAAEAAALAWVYGRRRLEYAGIVATGLAALAILHLVDVEYPLSSGLIATHQYPFVGPEGLTLTFFLGAVAFAAASIDVRAVRVSLAAVGLLLVTYAAPFELSGTVLIAAATALAVGGVLVERRVFNIPLLWDGPPLPGPVAAAERTGYAAAATAGILAVGAAVAGFLPFATFLSASRGNSPFLPAVPFTDERSLVALILAMGLGAAAIAAADRAARRIAAIAVAATLAYLLPFELPIALAVVGWCLLVAALYGLVEADAAGALGYRIAGAIGTGLGLLVTLVAVASPDRLVVDAGRVIQHPLLWSPASAALAALVVVTALAARLEPEPDRRRWVAMLAGGLGVYLLSIGVVDEFQARVGRGLALEELQKQAQVGLSVLWAVLGGLGFVGGLAMRRRDLRRLGLGLFVLVTVKVFVVDLSALDVAYRVLSFIALGVLLLGSAYLYQRLQPPREDSAAGPASPP